MKIQTLNQDNGTLVNASEFADSAKGRVIRVLHVDDDPCLLDVSREILSMENIFDIDVATSVDEAFKKLSTKNYDAIISDYEMPQKNGIQFLKELRQAKNKIPFILFTGKGREELAIKALNLDSDAYINKQGDTETVYANYHMRWLMRQNKSNPKNYSLSQRQNTINFENTINDAVALFAGDLNFKVINNCHGLSLFADFFQSVRFL